MKGDLDRVAVFSSDDSCPTLPIVEGQGTARAVVWPGVGASMRSVQRIALGPDARTIELKHSGEAVYFVLTGAGSVREGEAEQRLVKGSMVHVEPDTRYRFHAGKRGMELIGGPCPPDPALYRHLL